jgi:tetratricopeptide (TPR) repeat protein
LLAVKLFKLDPTNISYPANSKLFISLGILGILYSAKTLARNDAWQNNFVLYKTGVETAPDSWRAHNLLAVEYTKRIKDEKDPQTKKEYYEQAIQHFDRSAEILPSSEVYLLKGYAHEFGGQEDSAIVAYQTAIRLDSNNKTTYNNLGAVMLRKGRLDEAIVVLNKALRLDTAYTDAYANLAASYGNSGRFRESEHYYMIVMRQNPNQGKNVLQSISNIYKMLGEVEKSNQYQLMANKADH